MIARKPELDPKAEEEKLRKQGEDAPSAGEESDAAAANDRGVAAASESEGEEDEAVRLEGDDLIRCLEALLFAAPGPITRRRLYRMLRSESSKKEIDEALLKLEADVVSTGRGYELVEDASGLRFLSRAEFAPYVARLRGEKRRIRLSQAAFETLAVIAYRQPVGRADLDTIRGVQSGAIVKRLLEWGLISIVGRDEERIGRPHLYGTTKVFLEEFGLGALGELPEPEQFMELGESRLLIGLRDGESEDEAGPMDGDESEAPSEEQASQAEAGDQEAAEGAVEDDASASVEEVEEPGDDAELDDDGDPDGETVGASTETASENSDSEPKVE